MDELIKKNFLNRYKYPPVGNVGNGIYYIPNTFTDEEGYREWCEEVEKKAEEKFNNFLESELSNI